MTFFDEVKPRSGKASANERERDLARQLTKLMEMEDEETLRKALEKNLELQRKIPDTNRLLRFGAALCSAGNTGGELLHFRIFFCFGKPLLGHVIFQHSGNLSRRIGTG